MTLKINFNLEYDPKNKSVIEKSGITDITEGISQRTDRLLLRSLAFDRAKRSIYLGDTVAAGFILAIVGLQCYYPVWSTVETFTKPVTKPLQTLLVSSVDTEEDKGKGSDPRRENKPIKMVLPLKGMNPLQYAAPPGACRPLGLCRQLGLRGKILTKSEIAKYKKDGVRPHHGTDYGAPIGSAVQSVCDGTVIEVNAYGYSGGGTLGIRGDNNEEYRYVHLNRKSVAKHKKGDRVKMGQVIAYIDYEDGNWGSGPHLHFERYLSDGKLDWKSYNFLNEIDKLNKTNKPKSYSTDV